MKNRITYILVAAAIVIAVVFLILTATAQESQFFITVAELSALSPEEQRQPLVVSGAVDGASIVYDETVPQVTFTIVDIPSDLKVIEQRGGLAVVLEEAVQDPQAGRLQVVYSGVKPDLLKANAQAILKGQLGEDGRFYSDDLLLKCPSRYAEDIPEQAED
jgi:cytochrome c-type biogenesis protein CcmE